MRRMLTTGSLVCAGVMDAGSMSPELIGSVYIPSNEASKGSPRGLEPSGRVS